MTAPYKVLGLPPTASFNNLEWEELHIPKAFINCYPWGEGYKPVSYGQAVIIHNAGLALRLVSYEENPKAVYSRYGDPVYKDSCLEFFASLNPGSGLYLNLEVNSNGAFLAAVRKERKFKTPIDKLIDIGEIKIVPGKGKDVKGNSFWFIKAFLPFSAIEKLFGVGGDFFIPGTVFKGNFYKCGDETETPHYGSHFPINLPEPDFHRPEFFGDFVIV
ncbi:MAG: carbohydrate-binding family 9-like protein [Eubacteriales bacterium]